MSTTVPLCSPEPNHGEEASKKWPLSLLSLIYFTPKAGKLLAINFWHFTDWLFQMSHSSDTERLCHSTPAIPAGSGSFPVANPITEDSHLWWIEMVEWGDLLMFSTCKMLSLPLSWLSNGLLSFFRSCFRTWVYWNHQFTLTTGKTTQKVGFLLILNRNSAL